MNVYRLSKQVAKYHPRRLHIGDWVAGQRRIRSRYFAKMALIDFIIAVAKAHP